MITTISHRLMVPRKRRWQVIWPVVLLIVSLITVAAAQKPQAALPQVYIDTTWNPPTSGTTWPVHTSAQLSSALTSAAPGDIIELDAGTIYSGYFSVPAKTNPNNRWIYIESSAYANLPSPGTRVSPADAVNMPKIVTPGAPHAIGFDDGANYWRFVGVEIYSASTYRPSGYTPGVYYGYSLIDKSSYPGTSNIPDHIFFDRCYVHGDSTHDVQAGIAGNFSNFAVVDSYISEIHMKSVETQAVISYVTPGPIKLVNNHLEAAGENVMFGGAGRGAFGFVPSDIEVQNNYLYKPLSWVPKSVGTNTYKVKNAFELKSAQRVLFNSNTIANVWRAGQVGAAFLFTVRTSQSGDIAVVEDVTVTNNVFNNVVIAFNTLAADSTCGTSSYPNCHNAGTTGRWVISDNQVTLYDNTVQGGIGSHTGLIVFSPGIDYPNGGAIVGLHDVVLQHNTVVPHKNETCWTSAYFAVPGSWHLPFPHPLTYNIWVLDNALCNEATGDWGLQGTSGLTQYMGSPSTPPYDLTQRFYGNVMYVPSNNKAYTFPPHNDATMVAFTYVNPSINDYQLVTPNWTNTSDGQLSGVNFANLPASPGP